MLCIDRNERRSKPSGNILPGEPAPSPSDLIIVEASKRNLVLSNSPTDDVIQSAFARPASMDPTWGDWLGPCAKVTRRAEVPVFVTTAAGVWAFPPGLDAATKSRARASLVASLNTSLARSNDAYLSSETLALAALGAPGLFLGSMDWSAVVAMPFAVATNGTVDSWQSGQQCNTATRTAPNMGVQRLDPEDNPVGPNPPRTTAGSILPVLGTIAVAIAVVAVAVEAGPVIAAWSRKGAPAV